MSLKSGLAGLKEIDPLDAVPRLTLLVFVLYIFGYGKVIGTLEVTLALAGIFYTPLARSPWLWAAMAGMLGIRIFHDTDYLDNHFYLSLYWCIALCLTFCAPAIHRAKVLRFNAKTLLGLCMFFAVVWKAISPDYLDGSMFHFLLLVDQRFYDVARLFGGLTAEQANQNAVVLSQIANPLTAPAAFDFAMVNPDKMRQLAMVITWWTMFIECVFAVLFLLPNSRATAALRNTALILFAITTYPVAPVKGFGTLLLTMGYAQCGEDHKKTRVAYLATLLFVEIAGGLGPLSYL